MVSSVGLISTYICLLASGSSKIIPQATLCTSYANGNTVNATCGQSVCPYGCSWPFVTVDKCVPWGTNGSGNTTTQICHIGFWKESNTWSGCVTKFGSYQCSGTTSGFAACTGCQSVSQLS